MLTFYICSCLFWLACPTTNGFFFFFFSRMEDVGEILECPICNEPPRPGMPGVGLCPLGHYVCFDCSIKLNETIYGCPVCRQKPVVVYTRHHFIMSIVKLYTAQTVYTCAFEMCAHQAKGSDILVHEATCLQQPIACPKINCTFCGPISVYLTSQHECLMSVDMNTMFNDLWSFTIPMQQLFSLDVNATECSSDFAPRLLKGSRAYLAYINRYEDLIFYVGWLGGGEKSPFARYRLNMTVENSVGAIGGYFGGTFQQQQDKDGLLVTKNQLVDWHFWLGDSQYIVHVDIYLEH